MDVRFRWMQNWPIVEIQKNVFIGKNTKISSHSFICEGVHIEENVFLGHGVSLLMTGSPNHAIQMDP